MNYKFVLLIPILEILSFVLLGDFLGFWVVIFLILLTGFVGLFLIRSELNLRQIEKLVSEPNEWLFKKIAGVLLIIPGFVTDLLGIIMLVKPLRGYVWKNLVIKKGFNTNNNSRKNKDENIIEAEYRDLDEK
ncbi:MAG: hypothetical protein CMM92_02775 [Rickettsiales bacterium]|nr:hypothetical protein [Rickettsiales bacterium]RPG14885.1 MAG: FxsA family protein [Pelagibacteraceae bacterium TMED195]|tara:strand:+ start:4046 stop:4441 length:396 start_codon:yes stop_codon:yes gene_type:complete